MLFEDAELWMAMAYRQAKEGWGLCNPNPMVGAVIVKDGKPIGLGAHLQAGKAHAEINALASVPPQTDLRDAVLYVTLEPCCTTGRTPPCCEAIARSGISKVYVGCLDANPDHAGKGVQWLRDHGIAVEVGMLEEQCRQLNEYFFWWITHKRPWVILKMAMSLDGKIALPGGESKWITGPDARSRVQKLRQLSGMIMVGGRTALLDNPGLKVTEPANWPRQPIPAVWTSKSALPSELKIASDAVLVKPTTRAEWLDFLSQWGSRDVSVLLLEGGGELAANALECGIVNQVQFFIAPKIIGGRDSAAVVAGNAPASLADALKLKDVVTESLGDDLLYTGYPVYNNG